MATTTYNFKVPLRGVDDQPVVNDKSEPALLSELLCQNIMSANIRENILKFFDWGLDLKKTGILALDNADKQLLVNYIVTNDRLSVLGKGRLVEVLNVR